MRVVGAGHGGNLSACGTTLRKMFTLRWPEHPMLGAGSPYELVEEDVLGEPTTVFATRVRSYRELIEQSLQFGDREAFVFGFGERHISYAEHERLVASTAEGLASRW